MSRFHWGWRITIVYSIFALGTLGFVFFAFTQDVDLVREDYYQYTLDHDARMQARSNAGKLEGARVAYDGSVVHVQLPEDQISTSRGVVKLYRPASTTSDQVIDLNLNNKGEMNIPTHGLAQGKWVVTVSWTAADIAYEIETSIEVPA